MERWRTRVNEPSGDLEPATIVPGVSVEDAFEQVSRAGDPPLLVVTVGGASPDGCLVGFATQASMEPPRLLVCLSIANATYRRALAADVLAVHLVPRGRLDLARLFGERTADDGVDKLARCAWKPGLDGVPLLDGCPTRVIGRILERTPMGDHTGFLLQPVGGDAAGSADVLRVRDAAGFHPGHPA
jgi:flavin reductase (DIM6/NTAB) family NADH-FMN oxidoreductase RutF